MQYQSISLSFPKMHGRAPRKLSQVIRKPVAPVKFKAFKDAMEYYKERDKKEENKNEE